MKTRRELITVVTLCMIALIFCFPCTVLAGGSPNPPIFLDPSCPPLNPNNVPCPGEKIVGPVTKADLIAVFNSDTGQVDAFIFINGVLYFAELSTNKMEADFDKTTVEDIPTWRFPDAIADQFGVDFGHGGRVVIAEAKDITNFVNEPRVDALVPGVAFKHIISCDVKISFIVPRSK